MMWGALLILSGWTILWVFGAPVASEVVKWHNRTWQKPATPEPVAHSLTAQRRLLLENHDA